MMAWIRAFRNSSRATKMFAFQWAIYFLLLIASTIYCYARLDFVRTKSITTPSSTQQNK